MLGLVSLVNCVPSKFLGIGIGWSSCLSQNAGNHFCSNFHHVANWPVNVNVPPRLTMVIPLRSTPLKVRVPDNCFHTRLVKAPVSVKVPLRAFKKCTVVLSMPWKVKVPCRAFPACLVRFPANVSVELSSTRCLAIAVMAPVVSNVPDSFLPTCLTRLPENVNVPTRVMFLPILLVRLPTNVNTPSRFFATRLVSVPEKVSVPARDWKNVTPPLGTSHKERKSANTLQRYNFSPSNRNTNNYCT